MCGMFEVFVEVCVVCVMWWVSRKCDVCGMWWVCGKCGVCGDLPSRSHAQITIIK